MRFPGQYADTETGINYNGYRDFSPDLGRYVESDPMGLRAGINTYRYTRDNPLSNSDPSGLLTRGPGISDSEWTQVQAAEARIRAELHRSCACSAKGPGGCIPCDLVDDLLNALATVSVTGREIAGSCGEGGVFSRWVILTPDAFNNPAKCSCLASTLYHELLHDVGLRHSPRADPVNTAERQCKNNLCN